MDWLVPAGALPEYPVAAYPDAALEIAAAGHALCDDGAAGYDEPLWHAPDAGVLGRLLPAVLLFRRGLSPRIWLHTAQILPDGGGYA